MRALAGGGAQRRELLGLGPHAGMQAAGIGASWATRMRSTTLYKTLAVLLVLIAAALAANHTGRRLSN
jgi:hypothetical protein